MLGYFCLLGGTQNNSFNQQKRRADYLQYGKTASMYAGKYLSCLYRREGVGKRGWVGNSENRLYAGSPFPDTTCLGRANDYKRNGEAIEYFCPGHQLAECEEMASQTRAYEFEKNWIKNSATFWILPQEAIWRKLFVYLSGSYFIHGGTRDERFFCGFFSNTWEVYLVGKIFGKAKRVENNGYLVLTNRNKFLCWSNRPRLNRNIGLIGSLWLDPPYRKTTWIKWNFIHPLNCLLSQPVRW